ncbi:hypothetical protein TrST_g3433 [Triparma strigata]|uniref:SEC7 domain-containing protein n=1 Tax=Triparma strigata TaxID=1606541 RepID=A0A9W7A3F2_9STRA|nr:hypothetical protein TrST_g3433 [Triparma strigata]
MSSQPDDETSLNSESNDPSSPSSPSGSSGSNRGSGRPDNVKAWGEILNAVVRIRKESSRKHKGLRATLDELILLLQVFTAVSPPTPRPNIKDVTRDVVMAMNQTCVAKTNKMSDLAIETLTLMVVNKFISGETLGATPPPSSPDGVPPPRPPPTLIETTVNTVCSCSDSNDESVQLAMTKSLLTLISSSHCRVHEASLLTSIRASFHVYLVTKSTAVKDNSKVALTQILSTVFGRMEKYVVEQKGENPNPSSDLSSPSENSETASSTSTSPPQSPAKPPVEPVSFPLSVPITPEKPPPHLSSQQSAQPSEILFKSQYHKDAFLIFRALCKLSSKALVDESESTGMSLISSSPSDPLALHSKALSLSLILSILETCGPAFTQGDKFIYAVRHYLCVSLLKNCMSTNTSIVYLSLRIFVCLVNNFRTHLKHEIEVFVANIFLRVLDSQNSSHEQKCLVLEALSSLSEPETLSQIFLNYDCDINATNDLFKNIVNSLARVAKGSTILSNNVTADLDQSKSNALSTLLAGKAGAAKKEAGREAALRIAALEVLVAVLRAMLKAQGLEGGDDKFDESTGVRTKLQLVDRPKAAPTREKHNMSTTTSIDSALDEVKAVKSFEDTVTSAGSIDPSRSLSSDTQTGGEEEMLKNGSLTPTNGSSLSSRSASTADNNEFFTNYNQKRVEKEEFQTGEVKFKLNPKTGILHFVKHKFLEELEAKAVAQFLLANKDKLDKTQIGEILGKEPDYAFVKDEGVPASHGGKGFCVAILHEYVDNMVFNGLEFDEAIRLFLSGFRLPGEAQKIDRIMEKFAERYSKQNPQVFASADTAFILAFSIIMLNTDLHNPSIKEERRMTVESFIRNNRGIGVDGTDLPGDFLEGIFHRIQASAFSLKEDDDARAQMGKTLGATGGGGGFADNVFGASGKEEKKRKEEFQKEREELMMSSTQLMKQAKDNGNATEVPSLTPAEAVPFMFDVAWGFTIGSLSQILEFTEEPNCIALCLRGFVYAIRIASFNDMFVARDTFVNSLAKFTTLGSIKEIKYKNIECIRALLNIAIADGDMLRESWEPVLQCISQLAKLQLQASGMVTDEEMFENADGNQQQDDLEETSRRPSLSGRTSSVFSSKNKKSAAVKRLETENGRAVLEAISDDLIDKVFLNSVSLSVEGIEHFITQLVKVSAAEVPGGDRVDIGIVSPGGVTPSDSGGASARIFALQRIVEVADFNMNTRPRIVWTRIWGMMSRHFAVVGCHSNEMVSMYAIDSLRQLSFKFLTKPELTDFNFQRLFLRPFLVIMESEGSREDVRELILRCIDNMIRSLAKNIRSGWNTIFAVLAVSARDSNLTIAKLGLEIMHRLVDEHLEQLCGRAEDFVGMVKASVAFIYDEGKGEAGVLPAGLSMRAICHVACFADAVARGAVGPPPQLTHMTSETSFIGGDLGGVEYLDLDDNESRALLLWKPIIEGLAWGCIYASGEGMIAQRACVCALRAIFLRHGDLFSSNQMKSIISQTLFPPVLERLDGKDAIGPILLFTPSPIDFPFLFLRAGPRGLPAPDDENFLAAAAAAQSEGSSAERELGQAESLVEAMLADLRRGGDGSINGQVLELEAAEGSFLGNTMGGWFGMLVDIVHARKDPALLKRVVEIVFGFEEESFCCEALLRCCFTEIFRLADGDEGGEEWNQLVIGVFVDLVGWMLAAVKDLSEKSVLERKLASIAAQPTVPTLRVNESALQRGISSSRAVSTPYGEGKTARTMGGGGGRGEGDVQIARVELAWGVLYTVQDNVESWAERDSNDVRWNTLSDDEGDDDITEGGSFLDDSADEGLLGGGGDRDTGDWIEKTVQPLLMRVATLDFLVRGLIGAIRKSRAGMRVQEVEAIIKVLREAGTREEEEDLKACFQACDQGVNWSEGGKACSGGEALLVSLAAAAAAAELDLLLGLYQEKGEGGGGERGELAAFVEQELLDCFERNLRLYIVMDGELREGKEEVEWCLISTNAVVEEIFLGILRFNDAQLQKHRARLAPLLADFVVVARYEVRVLLSQILERLL